MIDPTHLRVGNVVNSKHGWLRVKGISPYTHGSNATGAMVEETVWEIKAEQLQGRSHDFRGVLRSTECEAVPLAPEVLAAAGFKLDGNLWAFHHSDAGYGLYSMGTSAWAYMVKDFSRDIREGFGPEYQMLHQVQNLYFTLTGEELPVNLDKL